MLELRNEMKDDTSENEVSFLSCPCWRVAGNATCGSLFKDRNRSQEKKQLKGNAFPQSCLAQQTAWGFNPFRWLLPKRMASQPLVQVRQLRSQLADMQSKGGEKEH